MLGDYVLHYPLTDFAVSLLTVAALVDLASRLLARPQWNIAVDWLLLTGFAGALAAVGSGMWLVAVQHHPHDDTLSLHHWFAYGTLATATVAVAARLFQRRVPKLSLLRTAALLISALLVSCAGFVGGKMAHAPAGTHVHTHGGEERATDGSDVMAGSGSNSTNPTPADAANPANPQEHHDDHPHSH